MTIRFLCPMGHPLAVPDNRAGKKGRCPVCRQRVFVPRPPAGASISDDEVADLLSEQSVQDDDEDESESEGEGGGDDRSSVAAGQIEVEDSSTPPQRPRPKTPAEPSGGPTTTPSTAGARAAAARAARAKRAAAAQASRSDSAPAPAASASDPPGEPHRRLSALVGEWDFRLKLLLEPGGTPASSIGTASAQWTLGERFLQIESQGTLLGASFSSHWTLGYDNAKRAYISCYRDDRSTGLFCARGDGDEQRDALRLFGDMHGWQPGQHSRAYLYVIRLLHENKWSLELHDVLLGEKVMEVAYTRQK